MEGLGFKCFKRLFKKIIVAVHAMNVTLNECEGKESTWQGRNSWPVPTPLACSLFSELREPPFPLLGQVGGEELG